MRHFAGILLAGTGLILSWFVATTSVDGPKAAIDRLRSMPLEHRRRLADALDRFDRLPSAEKKWIQGLDAQLSELSANEQARLRTTIRNYYRWEQSLEADQRDALRTAPAERRLELVREIRGQQLPQSTASTDLEPGSIWSRSATFNPLPLLETAYLVKAWFLLDEQGRAHIERLPRIEERIERLRELSADEDQRGNLNQVEEWENRILSRMPPPMRQRFEGQGSERYPFRFDPRSRSAPARKSQVRLRLLRSMESWLIQEFADDRSVIATTELLSFENSLPAWIRATFDPLPPEAARHRLSILYHLVLNDQELPAQEFPRTPEPPPGRPKRISPSSDTTSF